MNAHVLRSGANGGGSNNGGNAQFRSRKGPDHAQHKHRKDKKSESNTQKNPMMTTPVILGAKPAVKIMSDYNTSSSSSTPSKDSGGGSQTLGSFKVIEVAKMINENFEFFTDAAVKLAEYEDFLVVGIIGGQGVGKSSLLNDISGYEGTHPPFAVQTQENQFICEHRTTGVDFCVNAERLILLDTQPVFSSSVLLSLHKAEVLLGNDVVSYEHLLYVQALQIALFLLSVCHIVLVVQEDEPDLPLWRLLRSANMLKQNIADVSTVTDSQDQITEYCPEIVVVFNKLSPAHYIDLESSEQQLDKVLHRFFSFCKPKKATGYEAELNNITPHTPDRQSSDEISTAVPEQEFVSHFLIPFNQAFDSQDSNITPCYQVAKGNLANKIMAWQKRPFAKLVSEKEWLKNSGKIWDLIKRSTLVNEYNKILQKMQVYKAN